MSTNNDDDWAKMPENGENTEGGSRVMDEPEMVKNDRERISVSKNILADGSEQTTVAHPPRKLKRVGQLRDALMSGAIDLESFEKGCEEGMDAMKAIPCKNGTIAYEPDWPTRLAFRKFVVETVEGMPIKRQEIISKKMTTEEDLSAMLKKSRAFRRAVRDLLDRIEREIDEDNLSNKGGTD